MIEREKERECGTHVHCKHNFVLLAKAWVPNIKSNPEVKRNYPESVIHKKLYVYEFKIY